jgi:NADH-quinone oxidoreductase B subunit
VGIIDVIPKALDPLPGGKSLTNAVDFVVNWARANSLWPLTYGTSCCAIEMMATSMPRYDISRFGSEVFRASPRQADLIILAGTIVEKMAEPLKTLYEQMPGPKYVIAMGACTISGGPFYYDNYSVVKGANRVIPVDVYIPGCPPRPEALLQGLMELQKIIKGESIRNTWQAPTLNSTPFINKHQAAADAWAQAEKIKDEEMADARAKFAEENPDYKGYKHTRVVPEKFDEVERLIHPSRGLSNLEIAQLLKAHFPDLGIVGQEKYSEEYISNLAADHTPEFLIPSEQYIEFVQFIKNHDDLNQDFLIELTAIDYPESFNIAAHFMSVNRTHKIFVQCFIPKDKISDSQSEPGFYKAPSITSLFPAANWHEREVYDLFGIEFEGHPDMRRIFREDNMPGFPLRKDYEDTSRVVKRPY